MNPNEGLETTSTAGGQPGQADIAEKGGRYRIVLDSEDPVFGGHGRVDNAEAHFTLAPAHPDHSPSRLSLYPPNRTALLLVSD